MARSSYWRVETDPDLTIEVEVQFVAESSAVVPGPLRSPVQGGSGMSPIVVSTEVERPTAEVFAYATDPTRRARSRRTDPSDRRSHRGTSDWLAVSSDYRGRLCGYGVSKVLVPLVVRREARKEMPGNLATLKDRLETGQATREG